MLNGGQLFNRDVPYHGWRATDIKDDVTAGNRPRWPRGNSCPKELVKITEVRVQHRTALHVAAWSLSVCVSACLCVCVRVGVSCVVCSGMLGAKSE